MDAELKNFTLYFEKFRLEFNTEAPGTAPHGEMQIWLYNNEVGDGMEISTAEIDLILEKYYDENM